MHKKRNNQPSVTPGAVPVRWAVLAFALLLNLNAHAQVNLVEVDALFKSARITPDVLRDDTRQIEQEAVLAGRWDTAFYSAGSPFFAFGRDPANWWLRFRVRNNETQPRLLVLRLNRKNFDSFDLLQRQPDGHVSVLGTVSAELHNDRRFRITDGYHYLLTVPPGESELIARVVNRAGSMHLGLSLHEPENFSYILRRNGILFGLFCGVMGVSMLFTCLLYVQYRDRTYLFYLAYLVNILMRESYAFSADFGLFPVFQRHVTSVCVAITFGLFFRHFLQLRQLNPRLDLVVRLYIGAISVCSALMWFFGKTGQGTPLRYLIDFTTTTNLVFTLLALVVAFYYFRSSLRAKITCVAYLPIAVAFIVILLRNLHLFPNYPIIQHAVLWGFILEVLIFTVGFAYWVRSVENERRLAQLQLAVEQQERELAVQRTKDRIARDLHDDVAASMSGIRLLSQVARNQVGSSLPDTADLLRQINQTASTTLESVSDLIWAIKPGHDFLNDLADRIREHTAQLLGAQNIDYQLSIPRDLPIKALDAEARRNLFLIFKEAVNNALKYSQCQQMEISLQVLAGGQLCLSVRDNGVGFDLAKAKSGHGLSNVARRAADIGAECHIQSAPGAGTEVRIVLPLA
jgi:signal transduction histidine kinase